MWPFVVYICVLLLCCNMPDSWSDWHTPPPEPISVELCWRRCASSPERYVYIWLSPLYTGVHVHNNEVTKLDYKATPHPVWMVCPKWMRKPELLYNSRRKPVSRLKQDLQDVMVCIWPAYIQCMGATCSCDCTTPTHMLCLHSRWTAECHLQPLCCTYNMCQLFACYVICFICRLWLSTFSSQPLHQKYVHRGTLCWYIGTYNTPCRNLTTAKTLT